METFGNPFSKRSNPPTFSPEFLDKKKKNPSIVGAQHRRFTFTIFLDLNDQKKEEKKKEREKRRGARERLQKRAAGGGAPDISYPHPSYRQEYRVSTFPTTGPCEPFEPIGSIGPPSCLLSWQCFSRDPQTKADEFQRENPLPRCLVTKKAREAALEEAGQLRREISYEITGPQFHLLDTSSLSFSLSLILVVICYARHPSRHLPPRGRSLIYNQPSVIILWSRDYTRSDALDFEG